MAWNTDRLRAEPYRTMWRWEIALYKGDDIVDQGTVKEIAERRNVLKRTIYYYLMPAGHRRADSRKGSGLRAVRV